jgi:hypothetical protein
VLILTYFTLNPKVLILVVYLPAPMLAIGCLLYLLQLYYLWFLQQSFASLHKQEKNILSRGNATKQKNIYLTATISLLFALPVAFSVRAEIPPIILLISFVVNAVSGFDLNTIQFIFMVKDDV